MFGIKVDLQSDLDLDAFEVEIECPRCSFTNPVWMKQARLRDVIICRGCKANLQLDDGMNSIRKARDNLQHQFNALRDQINRRFR